MEYQLKEHLDLLECFHEKYIINNEPMPDTHDVISPDVYESWKRSKHYGVDPEFIATYKVPNDEFKQILKENEVLIESAIPYIENIYNFVKGSNFVIHLTDRNGCLLKYYADDTLINTLFKKTSMLDVGSIRNETISGTDSTALCMAIDEPVQVIGAEHYLKRNHAFFCSSAPIHDPDNNLIGILTVMGPKELHQKHTLGMACATANGIELSLQKRTYYQQLTMTNSLLSAAIDGLPAGIVTLDDNNQILHYNEKFIEIFQLPINNYKGQSIFNLLEKDSLPGKFQVLKVNIPESPLTATTTFNKTINTFATVRHITKNDATASMTLMTFREEREVRALLNKMSNLKATFTFESIIGNSAAITESKSLGENAAKSSSNVLILGASGTGKELLAQAIHNASDRKKMPFVTINCGSIPKNLIESELFGYERGAFTGAKHEGHPGKFELADKGTLFLDEIGYMPLELQASLLRVLQSHEITRVGGKYPKPVDVRIIAATNINLLEAVNNKTFRSDLYYRLNVLNILLPPLKDRKEDIPLLVNNFIDTYSKALKKGYCSITNEALYLLSKYDWPGNVRELENVIERAINIIPGTQIDREHLPDNIVSHADTHNSSLVNNEVSQINIADQTPFSTTEAVLSPEVKERNIIIEYLKEEHGHVNSVAQKLDMPASTLYRKLRKYNINAKDYKSWI